MKRLQDGTIVQDGLSVYNRTNGKNIQLSPYPTKAIITAVYYSDDKNNPDEDCVLCDLHVIRHGLDLFGVPFYLEKGSADNFIDYRPVESSKSIEVQDEEDPDFDKTLIDPRKMNGDMVLVVFVDGDPQQAVIIKTVPHTQSGKNGKCPSPRKGRNAGDHYRVRMNGLEWEIDKDGNLSIKSDKTIEKINPNKKITIDLSVAKNEPHVSEDQKQSIKIEIDNTEGSPKITTTVTENTSDQKYQKMEIDGTAQTIKVTNQHSSGENNVLMGPSGITVNIKGDSNVTIDGKSSIIIKDDATISCEKKTNITCGADVTADITGKLTATVSGDAKIDSGGTATIKASTKAIVDCSAIELGSGATEAVIKGNIFQGLFNGHTHPTAVGPSGPPTVPLSGTELSIVTKTK